MRPQETARDRVYSMVAQWGTKSGGRKKELPFYAFPGGYAILYLTGDNDTLCAFCASQSITDFLETRRDCALEGHLWDYYADLPQYPYIHWEGHPKFCAECGNELPSEYGPPD